MTDQSTITNESMTMNEGASTEEGMAINQSMTMNEGASTEASAALDQTVTTDEGASTEEGAALDQTVTTDEGASTEEGAALDQTVTTDEGASTEEGAALDQAVTQNEAPKSVNVKPKSTNEAPKSINDLKVGTELKGRVKRIELYGAFVDVGVGTDGLLHISQLGQQVRNVEDAVKAGDDITVYVLRVDPAAGRIALSMQQPAAMSWDNIQEGMIVTGKIVKLEKFGAFLDFGAERPGMIHVSEMANGYVQSPGDVVKEGDEVKAAVIKVNRKKRRIDLSIKALEAPPEPVVTVATPEEPQEYVPNAMEIAFRRAYDTAGEEFPEQRREKSGERRRPDKKTAKRGDRQREMDEIYDRTLKNHRG